jgi:hypothetical protein
MALLTVQHTVRDYQTWRALFDTLEEVRQDWGVTAESTHQLAGVPNTVLVLLNFATAAQAQGFLTNRAYQAAMQRAGAEGAPASRSAPDPTGPGPGAGSDQAMPRSRRAATRRGHMAGSRWRSTRDWPSARPRPRTIGPSGASPWNSGLL